MASAVEDTIRGIVGKGIETIAGINRRRQDGDREHRFLTGIHAPLHDERTLTQLAVTGTIPPELSGRYVRIGPNPFKPDPRGYHWFLGDGMVHGLRLRNGRPNGIAIAISARKCSKARVAPRPRRARVAAAATG